MKLNDANEEQNDFTYDSSFFQFRQRFRFIQSKSFKFHVAFVFFSINQRKNLFFIRCNKTKKIQKLITIKSSKLFDLIWNIFDKSRFDIQKIFKFSFIIKIEQFLDKSNVIKQKLTLNMQKNTSKYRVKKITNIEQTNKKKSENATLTLTTSIQKNSSLIIVKTHENDKQSQSFMIISWINTIKLNKTLLNEKFIVELINRRKLSVMNFLSRIYIDDHLRMNLIIDIIHTLINYTMLFVNLKNVEIIVRTWIIDNRIYDFFSKISWMKRINFNVNYATNKIIINDDDEVRRHVSIEIFSL